MWMTTYSSNSLKVELRFLSLIKFFNELVMKKQVIKSLNFRNSVQSSLKSHPLWVTLYYLKIFQINFQIEFFYEQVGFGDISFKVDLWFKDWGFLGIRPKMRIKVYNKTITKIVLSMTRTKTHILLIIFRNPN